MSGIRDIYDEFALEASHGEYVRFVARAQNMSKHWHYKTTVLFGETLIGLPDVKEWDERTDQQTILICGRLQRHEYVYELPPPGQYTPIAVTQGVGGYHPGLNVWYTLEQMTWERRP